MLFNTGIDLDKIILYVYCNENEKNLGDDIKVLEENGKLWLGETKCTKKFAGTYAKQIMEITNEISIKLCSRYGCKDRVQDIASDALVYVLEKCGDIEKNYSDNKELIIGIMRGRIYHYIRFSCLSLSLKAKREASTLLHKKFTNNKGSEEEINVFDRGIEDKEQESVQDEIERKVLEEIKKKQEENPEEACMELLSQYVELGFAREEALSKTSEKLGLSSEEMLELLRSYMIGNRRVRETKDGGYVLGE